MVEEEEVVGRRAGAFLIDITQPEGSRWRPRATHTPNGPWKEAVRQNFGSLSHGSLPQPPRGPPFIALHHPHIPHHAPGLSVGGAYPVGSPI